jgi:hypothetical protein
MRRLVAEEPYSVGPAGIGITSAQITGLQVTGLQITGLGNLRAGVIHVVVASFGIVGSDIAAMG